LWAYIYIYIYMHPSRAAFMCGCPLLNRGRFFDGGRRVFWWRMEIPRRIEGAANLDQVRAQLIPKLLRR
jgi:hypothetical protein